MQASRWSPICALDDIVPNTGVCALVEGDQVAVFRVGSNTSQGVYAIGNYDPNSDAAVLSRGLVGNLGERIVVASPIYKQHFDLETGQCLEDEAVSLTVYPVEVEGDVIKLAVPA